MMPHPLGLAVLCGLLSGALFMSLLFGLPGMLLVYFAQLPVLFAGLARPDRPSIAAIRAIVGDRADGGHGGGARLRCCTLPACSRSGRLLRRTAQGKTEWFPVGLLLTQLTVLAGPAVLAFTLLGSRPAACPASSNSAPARGPDRLGLLDETAAPSPTSRLAAVIPGFTASCRCS
jgi:hypothetical protein